VYAAWNPSSSARRQTFRPSLDMTVWLDVARTLDLLAAEDLRRLCHTRTAVEQV
jgi:hypothetical protein